MDTGNRPLSPEQLLLHAGWVRRLALRLVGDPNLAEDVVQETWVAALERPPGAGARARSVRAWLARVVRNSVLQRGRGEVRRTDREQLEARDRSSERSVVEAELVELVDGQRQVVQEVLDLPEPLRSTILLRYFQDLSSAEIARRQGIPPATVRSRLSRGLEALRERMDARFGGDRSSWCAVLVGASVLRTPPPPPGPTGWGHWLLRGNTLLKGALAMKVGVLLAAGVGVAALTVAGISALGGGEPARGAVREPAVVEPEAPPEEIPVELASPTRPEDTPAPSRVALGAAPEASPRPTAAPAAPEEETLPPCVFVARFVDAGGNSLSDVKWSAHRCHSDRYELLASATSGPDGVARLALPMEREREELLLAHEAVGFVSGTQTPVATSGEEVNLGAITLLPGVLIAGRVVDAEGRPVEGASVTARDPELPQENLGQMRRIGESGLMEAIARRRLFGERTDVDGRFEVSGPSGREIRLWAGAEGWRYTWTEPIALQAGQPLFGVELVLDPLEQEDRIAGIALDIDGAPLPYHYISYSFDDEDLSVSSGISTDGSGVFDLVVLRRAPHTFQLQGDEAHPGMVVARSVPPGTLDLELRLSAEGELELVVEDAEGRPIESLTVVTRNLFGSNSMSTSADHHATDGRLRLAIPGDRFEFEVRARGYGSQVLGPYEAAGCPTTIGCVLEPVPGVRGRVVVGGDPLAGAKVELYRQVGPGVEYTVNGFPSRVQPTAVDSVETGEDGAFALFPPEDGVYIVRAAPPEGVGRAAVESEPMSVTATGGREGLVLEPERGAGLLVIVRAAPGRDPAGVIVGITDGGGDRRTARADERGEARFDDLRPGAWVVMESDREISDRGGSSTASVGPVEYRIPWTCDLAPGETREVELQLEE